MTTKIYVLISGGYFRASQNVPKNHTVDVIDWDNLFSDGDTGEEWQSFDIETKRFIKNNYPQEYALIQQRIGAEALRTT